MRPIKFRAWWPDLKEMSYFDNISFREKGEDLLLRKEDLNDENNRSGFSYIEKQILMQFTGLHDKNGKEIYEGDIVSGKGIYEKIKSDKFKVIYHGNKCSACFIFADKNGLGYHPYEIKSQEIIGNIYENPELLEKK